MVELDAAEMAHGEGELVRQLLRRWARGLERLRLDAPTLAVLNALSVLLGNGGGRGGRARAPLLREVVILDRDDGYEPREDDVDLEALAEQEGCVPRVSGAALQSVDICV